MSQAFGIVNQKGRLVVSGDLNFMTVPLLWEQSLSLLAALSELNFDLENITSSNSAGLALLIEWMKYAKNSQKKICFHHIPSQLGSIVSAAGVNIKNN